MHTPIRLSFLSLVAWVFAACGTVSESPDVPGPSGPPRGDALRRAVVGLWHGTAHDGSDTTEAVQLTLGADGQYDLTAGAVSAEEAWSVHDGVVYLEQDTDEALAEGGICFVATRIDQNHIEGQWAWGRSASDCDDTTYEVVLDRDAANE